MDIPKKIHFTCPNKNKIENPIWIECLEKYYEIYENYEIIIHDDIDIYNKIEEHFPEFTEKVKQIKVGAVLADLFRYLILYLEGGIYSDLDCMPIKKVDSLLDEKYIYFHGNENKSNNFETFDDFSLYSLNKYILQKDTTESKHYFYKNPCKHSTFVSSNSHFETMKCLGHKMDIKNTSTILSYEIHKDWHSPNIISNNKLAYKNVCIAQWFMMTEPKQEIFLKMFMYCIENIDKLINLNKNMMNDDREKYHHDVTSTSGPLSFTKMVVENISEKITILPSDFFCNGSWGLVPFTENSFVSHKFTSSWITN
jgi:hypothetical protein